MNMFRLERKHLNSNKWKQDPNKNQINLNKNYSLLFHRRLRLISIECYYLMTLKGKQNPVFVIWILNSISAIDVDYCKFWCQAKILYLIVIWFKRRNDYITPMVCFLLQKKSFYAIQASCSQWFLSQIVSLINITITPYRQFVWNGNIITQLFDLWSFNTHSKSIEWRITTV